MLCEDQQTTTPQFLMFVTRLRDSTEIAQPATTRASCPIRGFRTNPDHPAPEVNVSLTGLGRSADTDLTLSGNNMSAAGPAPPLMPNAALNTS